MKILTIAYARHIVVELRTLLRAAPLRPRSDLSESRPRNHIVGGGAYAEFGDSNSRYLVLDDR